MPTVESVKKDIEAFFRESFKSNHKKTQLSPCHVNPIKMALKVVEAIRLKSGK